MRMRIGECRMTKNGAKYCRGKKGVKFVGRGRGRGYRGRGTSGRGTSGLSGARRGRKMRKGECRRTRAGVKYCYGAKGNRFKRG